MCVLREAGYLPAPTGSVCRTALPAGLTPPLTEGQPVCIPRETGYIPAPMGNTCATSWPRHLGSCRGGARWGKGGLPPAKKFSAI